MPEQRTMESKTETSGKPVTRKEKAIRPLFSVDTFPEFNEKLIYLLHEEILKRGITPAGVEAAEWIMAHTDSPSAQQFRDPEERFVFLGSTVFYPPTKEHYRYLKPDRAAGFFLKPLRPSLFWREKGKSRLPKRRTSNVNYVGRKHTRTSTGVCQAQAEISFYENSRRTPLG